MTANSMDIIMYVRVSDGRILEVNAAALEAYGYTREELLRRTVYEIRSEPTLGLVTSQLAEASEDGILFETIHRRKDGSLFPVEVHSRGVTIRGERILISVVRDISRRKRAEQALQESEERYRSLFACMSEGFALHEVVYDAQGKVVDYRYLDVNPAFEQITGLARDQVVGKRISEVIPAEDQKMVEVFGNVALTGEPVHLESYSPSFQKSLDVNAFCPKPGRFATVFTDITHRKKRDDELRTLSSAVTRSPASVVITDAAGAIQYVNPKFTEVTGYQPEEVYGRNPRILKTDLTAPSVHAQMWATILVGKSWRGEFCNRKKDGSLYWELASISPITDENGSITHFVAVKEDITEKKLLEQELQAERDFVVQVMNTMGQGLTVTDASGCYQYVNPTFARLLNVAPRDLYGKRPADVMNAADRRPNPIEAGQSGPMTYEAILQSGDGARIPVVVTEVQRWQDGACIGATSVITDLTEQKRVEEHLRHLGTVDMLTGAYNRSFFETELVHIEGSWEYPVSVIVADVDNLKVTNDTLGHQMGDVVIKRTATILKSVVRSTDIIARTGGDEFALILARTGEDEGRQILDRIRESIAETNRENPDLPLKLSLGIATTEQGNLVATMRTADTRMYEEKRMHKRMQADHPA